jgi:hypothetical protein
LRNRVSPNHFISARKTETLPVDTSPSAHNSDGSSDLEAGAQQNVEFGKDSYRP